MGGAGRSLAAGMMGWHHRRRPFDLTSGYRSGPWRSAHRGFCRARAKISVVTALAAIIARIVSVVVRIVVVGVVIVVFVLDTA